MRRRDVSITIALCASLALHAVISLTLTVVHIHQLDSQWPMPPLNPIESAKSTPIIQEPDHPELRSSRFGEAQSSGYAINRAEGEQILHAPQGSQDQAWLSRDPRGPLRFAEEPSPSTAMPGLQQAARSTPAVPRSLQPADPSESTPFGPSAAAASPAMIARLPAPPPVPDMIGVPTSQPAGDSKLILVEAAPASAARPRPAPKERPSERPKEIIPGIPVPPGDFAQLSDSESDPFARIGSARMFTDGSVEPRLGRKFKMVRPRGSLKALTDTIAIANPTIIVSLAITTEGEVRNVTVLKSTGSAELDLSTTTALYKSWFEPGRDQNGKPLADVIVFEIRWITVAKPMG